MVTHDMLGRLIEVGDLIWCEGGKYLRKGYHLVAQIKPQSLQTLSIRPTEQDAAERVQVKHVVWANNVIKLDVDFVINGVDSELKRVVTEELVKIRNNEYAGVKERKRRRVQHGAVIANVRGVARIDFVNG